MGLSGNPVSDGAGSQPATWMILEDDFSLRSLLEEMIRLWGRIPLTFPDGFRAMAWLDEVAAGRVSPLPEVALLDIRVPGPQGPEIAHRMRHTAQTASIPIVIMTAYRVDADEKQKIVEQAQPNEFINKGDPIFDMLKDLLERVIREAKGEPPAEVQPAPPQEAAPAPEPAPVTALAIVPSPAPAEAPAPAAKDATAPAPAPAPAPETGPQPAPAAAPSPEPEKADAPPEAAVPKADGPEPKTDPPAS